MTSPPGTGSDSLTCPQCHKHVDQAAWVLHPRYCTAADPTAAAAAPAPLGLSEGREAHPTKPAARKGSDEISIYLIVGVILQFVGGAVLGAGFTNLTAADVLTGDPGTSGGAVIAVLIGWAAVGAGSFCILVAVIAKGVQIGNRAS